ncbi:hypothetical protein BC939DRAFT_455600 [Gamsiella multidivaricata]|uniref:uncharacterized protein n=1 Tax=Gamsiella multidivaricata TaxID=101098 RepID=UPI00221EC393|nr:uncharacterized protein BC939DRAFT_455600 [Gamsiella multidivaricata]KAG0350301.1 hypothetical protein BGZ54_003916 [Gamsiella multidivaricata]KAI7821578.1 hypothetical protein BC939DRAFT_455600 [Gamsiella multidivaricata]
MTSTTGAWSNLFHGIPNTTPASRLYTEEAIQNEELTADQVIEKAQSSASLLFEMAVALREEHETLQSLEQNDIIQTLRRECQEMSDYLSERIWQDSGDSLSPYQAFESSSLRPQPKTTDEEAQIAAFISCNEQIQTALRRYDEIQDFLQAKQMQEGENTRDAAYRSSHSTDVLNDTYTAAAAALDDRDADEDGYTLQTHLRKSEQPLIWKLDPREDFKAGQAKMKKGLTSEEWRKKDLERMMEKCPQNGIHGMAEDPLRITPEMLSLDDATEDENSGSGEFTAAAARATAPVIEVDEDGLERINNRALAQEDEQSEEAAAAEEEEKDDKGVLSDDSWEEIPEQGMVGLSVDDDGEGAQEADVTSTVSSSSSSFLITPAEAASRASTPPSVNDRKL